MLLLQRSADQEQPASMVAVADLLFDGNPNPNPNYIEAGTAPNQPEAMRLYRVAGEAGSARALFNIGWAHQSGVSCSNPNPNPDPNPDRNLNPNPDRNLNPNPNPKIGWAHQFG
jgi:TPR repeat protein